MKLLAIDTAFEHCSVALWQGGEVLQRKTDAPRAHAERVLPWVQALLAETELPLGALDAIAFSRGPGSFTSLRIGISVVQGLAWGADLPVAPVSSLAAVASAGADRGCEHLLVAMDARMGEVYSAAFAVSAGGVRAVGEERVCAPGAVVAPPGEGWVGIGNGFDRFEALRTLGAGLAGVRAELESSAATVAKLAAAWLLENEGLPAIRAQPVYLRDKVAEIPSGP